MRAVVRSYLSDLSVCVFVRCVLQQDRSPNQIWELTEAVDMAGPALGTARWSLAIWAPSFHLLVVQRRYGHGHTSSSAVHG